MDTGHMIESILDDINNMLKAALNGQPIQSCAILTGIAQKIVTIRTGVENEMKTRDNTIEKLKNELQKRGVEVAEIGGVNE
jgi:hypothetical protein